MNNKPKVVVIVGPTASGKTALSIELALKCNGEIISADSRQVYKGLDIGTGKVTREEMRGVGHHLLDVANPTETYTVHSYAEDARHAIHDILSRGKLPIIVGGTFLYIDALLGRVSTPEVLPNEKLRTELEKLTLQELTEHLAEIDPLRASSIDTKNKRRLVRAIEIVTALGVVPEIQSDELYASLSIGISIPKEELKRNIHSRLTARIENGMIEEVQNLLKNGLSHERLAELGIEYKCISGYLQNKITQEEMCSLIEVKSMQYAKRQMTWLKRDSTIVWVSPDEYLRAEQLIQKFLT
jgi:tRNA dimethylallyltransferase